MRDKDSDGNKILLRPRPCSWVTLKLGFWLIDKQVNELLDFFQLQRQRNLANDVVKYSIEFFLFSIWIVC